MTSGTRCSGTAGAWASVGLGWSGLRLRGIPFRKSDQPQKEISL